MIGINLIADSVLVSRRRRRRVQRWVMSVLAAGVVASIPVGIELSRHQQVQSLRGEKRLYAAQIESMRSELNEVGIENRGLSAQTARANALRTKRSWSRLLAMVSRTLPEELWLTSMSTDPAVPIRGHRDLTPRKSAAPAGEVDDAPRVVTMEAPRALKLAGYALEHRHLYEFMSRLKSVEAFGDVSLTKAVEEPVFRSKAVRFEIRCTW